MWETTRFAPAARVPRAALWPGSPWPCVFVAVGVAPDAAFVEAASEAGNEHVRPHREGHSHDVRAVALPFSSRGSVFVVSAVRLLTPSLSPPP